MKVKKFTALLLACSLTTATVIAGCGNSYNADEAVATLNGTEISVGLANFMAQVTAVSYDSYLGSYYGASMWDTDMSGDGSTLTDTVRNSTMDDLETDYLLEAHLSDYGIEITDDDLATIDQYAADFIEQNSKDALEKMGATEEYVKEMMRLYMIQEKMHTAIIADVDTEVSDEEAAQRTFSYYNVTLPVDDTEEADSTEAVEESTEDKTAQKDAFAEEVDAAAKEDFDGVADAYSQVVSTYSYSSGDESETFDAKVIAAAEKLSEGEVSDVIKSDGGSYYVIRLDSEFDEQATENKKAEIVSQRQSDRYTEVTDGYKKDADWTVNDDVLANITFTDMYSVVTAESTEAATETAADTEAATEE